MKFKRHLEIVKGRIDAVPLVNLALLVLMFFLLGSAYVLQPGVSVDMLSLPLSTLNVGAPAQGGLMITVTRDDLIFFNDERTDLTKLKSSLESSAQRFPGIRLVVKADQRVSYERLVQIFDLVKVSGIQHVLLATRPLLNQPATPPIKTLLPAGQRP